MKRKYIKEIREWAKCDTVRGLPIDDFETFSAYCDEAEMILTEEEKEYLMNIYYEFYEEMKYEN